MEKLKTNLKDILLLIGFTIAFIISLCFIGSVKEAVINAVKSCVFGIVPSLFTVCVLCGWATEYGIFDRVFRGTNINASIICAFILGNIGGYPIGAKTLCELVKKGKIASKEAEIALCCAFSPGPAFCIGVISPMVFGNSALGWIVYLSILLANLIIFFIYKKSFFKNENNIYESAVSFSDCMTSSVTSAAYSMTSICSAILFFSAVSAVISDLIPSIAGNNFIFALMEISSAARLSYNGLLTFVSITSILAFGGLCVLMQIKSLIGKSFSIKLFLKTRILQILLSALISSTLYILTKRYIPASAQEYTYIFTRSESFIPFICILGMTAISITCRKNQRRT